MAYDSLLAGKIAAYLSALPGLEIEEKEMFRGLTFMINGKMCISVSEDSLMCRFDPELQEEVAAREGYRPMQMRGREYRGFCYVDPEGFRSRSALAYWIGICLDFNPRAKATRKRK